MDGLPHGRRRRRLSNPSSWLLGRPAKQDGRGDRLEGHPRNLFVGLAPWLLGGLAVVAGAAAITAIAAGPGQLEMTPGQGAKPMVIAGIRL